MYATFWSAPEEVRRWHKTPWSWPCRGREPLSTVAKVSTLMLRKKASDVKHRAIISPPPQNVFVQPKAIISCTAPHIFFKQYKTRRTGNPPRKP